MTTSTPNWDHSTDENFYKYYAGESATEETAGRFKRIRDRILSVWGSEYRVDRPLDVADIGCGAGTQSMVWAELGHTVHAIDVNGPLVELGRKRAEAAGKNIDFRVGSATALPWSDESMDVCVALELLEHVAEWEACIREFTRVLRPGGALFLTTTNVLCPVQAEFTLPLYSWYPGALKRKFEKLAFTTRPEIANYARYPAVNWFSFYSLARWLKTQGFGSSLDRFDLIDTTSFGNAKKMLIVGVRRVKLLRCLGQLATPGTIVLAQKDGRSSE